MQDPDRTPQERRPRRTTRDRGRVRGVIPAALLAALTVRAGPARPPRLLAAAVAAFVATGAGAHPHVFIDGGVDFVFGPDNLLEELRETWIYDEFETLYMLSANGLGLSANGALDEADRLALVEVLRDWPEDYDGSAHPVLEGEALALDWPEDIDAELHDGRLHVTFARTLATPVRLEDGAVLEVGFQESTYFFDFSVTAEPWLIGAGETCAARVEPFDADSAPEELLETLAQLGRDDSPADENVGARLADRIIVRCG